MEINSGLYCWFVIRSTWMPWPVSIHWHVECSDDSYDFRPLSDMGALGLHSSFLINLACCVTVTESKCIQGGVDHGDHPPITPVRAASESEVGGGDAWRIYDYVVRHFLGRLLALTPYFSALISIKFSHLCCHSHLVHASRGNEGIFLMEEQSRHQLTMRSMLSYICCKAL